MLTAARRHYRQQQRVTTLGVGHARRVAVRGPAAVARVVATYQLANITVAEANAVAELEEQGIDPAAEASVNPPALLTDQAAAARMASKTQSSQALDLLVASLIRDAGHTAGSVGLTARPAVTGHVRSLNPPTCPRCAVLAGRVYRWSQGFQRHPGCDCVMTPTNETVAPGLVTDPAEAFRRGDIRGLSKADTEALAEGADISQVVNVRRKAAGITFGSSVVERAGRPTPFGIYRMASDRAEAVTLLRRFGYLV